jgi:putative membrane protein
MALSEAEHDRIAAAVAAAELKTSGEIYCVLAPRVSEYRETPLAWAAGAALVLPALAVLVGWRPETLLDLINGWSAGHRGDSSFAALAVYALSQAVVFVIAALLVAAGPIRRWLTPASLKAERVHRAAMEQFLAKGLHLTRGRTGVLIFASLAERRAEVVADEGIYAAAPKQVWDEVVQLLIAGLERNKAADGFIAAIQRSGEILAEHVPPGPDNPNELPDRLVELP